jgi:hypothetical protein
MAKPLNSPGWVKRRTGTEMSRADVTVYRQHAAECVEIAQDVSDPVRKIALLNMAQSWLTLAEHSEKQTGETLVYETPEPRQHVAQQQQQPQSDAKK